MKKRGLIAIIFSDLHLNIWSKFNDGLKRTRESFRVLSVLSEKYPNVPALFCGDLFHKPESIDTDLLEMWFDFLPNHFPQWGMWYIDGNHDLKHQNSILKPKVSIPTLVSANWMKSLNLEHVPFPNNPNIIVHGIPYIDNNIKVNEYLRETIGQWNVGTKGYKHILMLHTTYPGAKDTDGREVESPNSINPNLLNKFDLVLCGHIHKPQRLGKKVYMIGAPIQQRRTDKNCKMGYWELYDDLTMVFKELKGFPKFIDVESEEDIKDDGNYYTVIPPKPSNLEVSNHKITKRLSKKSLVRKYMRAKGLKDDQKKNLLISILNKTEQ